MDIYATELMGAKTYDVAGNYVGRVREFFIEPAEAPNRVSHYLLSRGHFQPLVAKHDQVASVAAGKMELSVIVAGGSEGFAGSTDHRYPRPKGRACK